MQRILAVALSALFLICAAPSAPGKDLIPFRSSGVAQLLAVPTPGAMVQAVDVGRATPYGNFTSLYDLKVNLCGAAFIFTGTYTSTFSNGDTITFAIAVRLSLVTGEFTGLFTPIGGTGRFKGICGGLVTTSGVADLNAGSFFYESSGVLPSVGSTKQNLR